MSRGWEILWDLSPTPQNHPPYGVAVSGMAQQDSSSPTLPPRELPRSGSRGRSRDQTRPLPTRADFEKTSSTPHLKTILSHQHTQECHDYKELRFCAKGIRCQRIHDWGLFDPLKDLPVALDALMGTLHDIRSDLINTQHQVSQLRAKFDIPFSDQDRATVGSRIGRAVSRHRNQSFQHVSSVTGSSGKTGRVGAYVMSTDPTQGYQSPDQFAFHQPPPGTMYFPQQYQQPTAFGIQQPYSFQSIPQQGSFSQSAPQYFTHPGGSGQEVNTQIPPTTK